MFIPLRYYAGDELETQDRHLRIEVIEPCPFTEGCVKAKVLKAKGYDLSPGEILDHVNCSTSGLDYLMKAGPGRLN